MKKIYMYMLISILFTNCKAQETNKQINKQTMKTFDIKNFNKNRNGNEYTFVTENGVKVTQYEWEDEYEDVRKNKNSYIEQYKSFYKNGKIKMEVKRFPNNFLVGVMKEYDEQGNLIKETDYDAPYKFTWEDILAFIEKRNIDMNAYGFYISRGTSEKGTAWSITYNKSEKDMLLGVIIIDGMTGKIIKEFDEEYPSEE